MHSKTFEKTKRIMETKYKNSLKYRNDYYPENYHQLLKCWDCGLLKNIRNFPYRKNYKFNKEKRCKTCNRNNTRNRRINHTKEQVINIILYQCRVSCKREKLGKGKCNEFEINVSSINKLLEEQNYLCIYSGKKLEWNYNDNYKCSIDRINSNKGYISSNIQLVGRVINQAKSNLSHIEFINLIKSVKLCRPINNSFIGNNSPDINKINKLIKSCRSSAIRRQKNIFRQDESNIFNLTLQDVLDINEKQHGKCIYSGYNLWNMGELPSIDRINSSKGYLRINIQLTTFKVNQAKNDLTHDEFMDMVNCIYDYSINKNILTSNSDK